MAILRILRNTLGKSRRIVGKTLGKTVGFLRQSGGLFKAVNRNIMRAESFLKSSGFQQLINKMPMSSEMRGLVNMFSASGKLIKNLARDAGEIIDKKGNDFDRVEKMRRDIKNGGLS